MIPSLNDKQIFDHLNQHNYPYLSNYYAFYSSWYGGITTNPHLMLIPLDDHMAHRGDGVFEAMKAINRSVYLLDAHLQRLYESANKIEIQLPFNISEIKNIIIQTLKVANQENVMIRLFISRGPGNFTVNPYDTVSSQLYIAITKLVTPTKEQYENGVSIGKSQIPCKSPLMSQVKSCNYLPNVLMKKEAVDRKLDYVISLDENNFMTESATENFLIIDQEDCIIHPPLNNILKGTTMIRVCELARENGFKTAIKPISTDDIKNANEAMITGTSLNVLPISHYENEKINDGKPGKISMKLNELIKNDIEKGPYRTLY